MKKLTTILTVAALVFGGAKSLRAAPDDTLGMALMSASVNADGSLARGSGAISVTKSGSQYHVTFERSLAGCTCTATVGGNDGQSEFYTPFFATANCPGIFAPSAAVVGTSQQNGTTNKVEPADLPFQLIVFCPK